MQNNDKDIYEFFNDEQFENSMNSYEVLGFITSAVIAQRIPTWEDVLQNAIMNEDYQKVDERTKVWLIESLANVYSEIRSSFLDETFDYPIYTQDLEDEEDAKLIELAYHYYCLGFIEGLDYYQDDLFMYENEIGNEDELFFPILIIAGAMSEDEEFAEFYENDEIMFDLIESLSTILPQLFFNHYEAMTNANSKANA